MWESPILSALASRILPAEYQAGLSLLSQKERRQALALLPLVTVSAVVDMVAMSTILPLMAAIVAPDSWATASRFGGILAPILPASRGGLISTLLTCVICMLIVAAILNILARRATNAFTAKCRIRLTHEIVGRLLKAPYIWFLGTNSALTTRAVSVDIVRWGQDFIGRIFSIAQTVVLGVVATIFVGYVAPYAGAVTALMTVGIAFGLSRLTRAKMRHYSNAELSSLDRSTVSLAQLLTGIKDIKLSGHPEEFSAAAARSMEELAQVQTRRNTLRQVLPVLTLLAGQVAMVSVVGLLWWIGLPTASIAEQIVFLTLVSARLLPAANRLFVDFSVMWDAIPYVKNIQLLDKDLPILGGGMQVESCAFPANWERMCLVDVFFAYPGATRTTLQELNISLERGGAYGLVGPSGGGKTTTVDLLLRLLEPTHGTLVLDGANASEILMSEWRLKIGYVAQHPYLTDDSLLANIAFGVPADKVDREAVIECARMANLDAVIKDLPNGLDTRLGERGVRLSGGQRQRVAIARALYKKPEILILDEATSALDSIAERAIQDAIDNLHGKVTLVVIAHRISTVRDCDQIWVLESGKVQASGSYNSLMEASSLFRQLASSTEV